MKDALPNRLLGLMFLAIMLLAALAAGAAEIVGPPQVEAGKPAWFRLAAAEGERAFFFPMPGCKYTFGGLHIKPGSAMFWATEPGAYTVAAIAGTSWQDAHSISRVVVVTGATPPNPLVPPVPEPGGPYQVALVYEKDTLHKLPKSQQTMLKSLVFREALEAAGHVIVGVVDRDAKTTPGARIRVFLDACKGDAMPRLVIAGLDGKGLRDMPLPATQAKVLELLKKGGP